MACSRSSVFTSVLLAFPYVCCLLAGPLRHVHASRVPGLLRGLRPIPRLRRTVRLSRPADGAHTAGPARDGSRVHQESIGQPGTQLCPGSIATVTPQAFTVTSPLARLASYAVSHPRRGDRALHPGPYPPGLSRCHAYGALPLVPARMPSGLARRTRAIWQSWHVPALSALLPALPGTSRIRLRSASTGLLRQPGEKASHLLRLSAPHGAPAPHGARFPRSAPAPDPGSRHLHAGHRLARTAGTRQTHPGARSRPRFRCRPHAFGTSAVVHSRSPSRLAPDASCAPFPQCSPPRLIHRSSLRWFRTSPCTSGPGGPTSITSAAPQPATRSSTSHPPAVFVAHRSPRPWHPQARRSLQALELDA